MFVSMGEFGKLILGNCAFFSDLPVILGVIVPELNGNREKMSDLRYTLEKEMELNKT